MYVCVYVRMYVDHYSSMGHVYTQIQIRQQSAFTHHQHTVHNACTYVVRMRGCVSYVKQVECTSTMARSGKKCKYVSDAENVK